jgi:hypothetical protein
MCKNMYRLSLDLDGGENLYCSLLCYNNVLKGRWMRWFEEQPFLIFAEGGRRSHIIVEIWATIYQATD